MLGDKVSIEHKMRLCDTTYCTAMSSAFDGHMDIKGSLVSSSSRAPWVR